MMKKYTGVVSILLMPLLLSACFASSKQVQDTSSPSTEPLAQVMTLDNGQSSAAPETQNTVVAFFWNVELRYAEEPQLDEIIRALQDMSTLSARELKTKRYADFYGGKDEWNLLQLVYAYFVPEVEVALDSFYDDIENPESREIVRQTLSDIEAYRKENPQNAIRPGSEPTTGW